ncbi:hypothetical protein AAFF_G00012620 [Aldrovandia affinis]|uniref:Uncharacterized protein n=1 Tax=Aldrovandia affinis TaxID=143900 RepID=A0AAD7S6Q8_9TELE|nr:hypothetical protein AAFF_G00012620 [Aldrovandia affinis]
MLLFFCLGGLACPLVFLCWVREPPMAVRSRAESERSVAGGALRVSPAVSRDRAVWHPVSLPWARCALTGRCGRGDAASSPAGGITGDDVTHRALILLSPSGSHTAPAPLHLTGPRPPPHLSPWGATVRSVAERIGPPAHEDGGNISMIKAQTHRRAILFLHRGRGPFQSPAAPAPARPLERTSQSAAASHPAPNNGHKEGREHAGPGSSEELRPDEGLAGRTKDGNGLSETRAPRIIRAIVPTPHSRQRPPLSRAGT